jgi:lipopolysaccharide export system permease protein
MSDLALARPALLVAAGAMLVCYFLNLILVPASLTAFRNYEFEIRNQIAAFLLEPGVFTPVTYGVTVYVQSRGSDNSLQGILIEDSRQLNAPATILARSGQLLVNAQGPVVVLENGSREQVDPKTGRLDVLVFQRNVISLAQTSSNNSMDMTDSAEASLTQLLHPGPPLTAAEQAKWLVEAQRRLSMPLSAVSYTLIGLLAILGGIFRRHGGFMRPLLAVIAVTTLVALGLGVNNLAARSLGLLPLIWVTVLLPGLMAAAFLFMPQRLLSFGGAKI